MPPDDPLNPYAPPKAIPKRQSDEGDEVVLDRPKPRWKTVVAFGTPARAVEALKLLENARIECRVVDDGTAPAGVSFHWVRSNPLGGHLVQVHPDDLGHAARVLGTPVEADETDARTVNLQDERMKKALALAFFGTFVCPLIAHVGSLAMVLGTAPHLLTEVGRKRRRWAMVIDVVVLGVAIFMALTEPTPTPLERARTRLPEHPDPGGLRR